VLSVALQVTNPLYLWQLWRADARHACHCFSKHNSMMDDKVAALLKVLPPDYTIAGELVLEGGADGFVWDYSAFGLITTCGGEWW
jgi:hypothetical protein